MSERNIPHLRDIFGFQGNWGNKDQHRNNDETLQYKFQDLRLSKGADNDSAVPVGSTSKEELHKTSASNKKKKQRSSRRDNTRTLTERDVKHLERHLSMKKTIRKKIMRDLQQAFVEDPNEFRVEDITHEQLKAQINIQSLSFGTPQTGKKAPSESNFLDMLRGGSTNNTSSEPINDDEDSGHDSPTREYSANRLDDYEDEDDDLNEAETAANKKTSFWRRFTMKGRAKR